MLKDVGHSLEFSKKQCYQHYYQVPDKYGMNEYFEGFKWLCVEQCFHFADEEIQRLSDLPKVNQLINMEDRNRRSHVSTPNTCNCEMGVFPPFYENKMPSAVISAILTPHLFPTHMKQTKQQ